MYHRSKNFCPVSRYAYDGGFRYRQQDIPDEEDFPWQTHPSIQRQAMLHGLKLLRSDSNIYICGSWSGFAMEESTCR